MTEGQTNSERYREERKHQVDERRESIIEAAQTLFLDQGLEHTTMLDIAEAAHISKVTLYRYFPDRHPIAFEVALRMLEKISEMSTKNTIPYTAGIHEIRISLMNLIREFDALKDAYRYIGIFDHLYAGEYPSVEIASMYEERMFQIPSKRFKNTSRDNLTKDQFEQIVTIVNMVMTFLEKMAAKGELMAKEQEVSMEKQFKHFEKFVSLAFDSIINGVNDV